MLTQARVVELLNYDPETGLLTWKDRQTAHKTPGLSFSQAGKRGGAIKRQGNYCSLQITVDRKKYKAHTIIWLYVYGRLPKYQIDHIDGDALNNRINNLRDVPQSTNMQNLRRARKDNKLGLLGVSTRHDGKFVAQIARNKQYFFLGVFDDPHEAHAAYLKKKRELHEGCTI